MMSFNAETVIDLFCFCIDGENKLPCWQYEQKYRRFNNYMTSGENADGDKEMRFILKSY